MSDAVSIRFETPSTHSHFFGYYDKSPLDATGSRLLCHRADFDGRPITADDTATVGYWDLETERFVALGETAAFNWQQGAMLQWLPPDYESRVLYNDRADNSFVSVLVDTETGTERRFPRPIYAVHPSGEFALAANYERLYHCRPGYNYRGVDRQKWDRPMHEDDGIYRVDLDTGATEQILSTPEVCNVDSKPVFERRDNWLEHMLWNPSGTRFAFFHRWADGNGSHGTRLFTAAPDGSNLYMFPDTEFYSHMGWHTDDRFTIWTTKPSVSQRTVDTVQRSPTLKRLVRPVYRFARDRVLGDRAERALPRQMFVEFRDQSESFSTVGEGVIEENGHNTWSDDGRWMLTDTYADEDATRRLFVWDDKRDRLHTLGTFETEYAGSVYRCDLHPRWNHDDDLIVVDSAHEPNRQMLVLEPDLAALADK